MSSDNVIYFDNSATSWPKPRETGEAMMYYLNDVGANPGRSGHSRSVEAGQIVLNARENLCRLFNVKLPQQIAFTTSRKDWSHRADCGQGGLRGLLRS